MKIPTQSEFVAQIDAFLSRHDMKESRLAREATGEPGLIAAIRSGRRSPTLNTVEKLSDYMTRTDAEAQLRAKLSAELEICTAGEDVELPFLNAPPGAASSRTSSSTTELQTSREGTASCPVCSTADSLSADQATKLSSCAPEACLSSDAEASGSR